VHVKRNRRNLALFVVRVHAGVKRNLARSAASVRAFAIKRQRSNWPMAKTALSNI